MSETQNLSQALVDAMSIIVDYNNSRLSKDETVECEIIRKKDLESGEFIVRYLNGTFSAFSNSPDLTSNLEIGDMVYVLIPRGDTSERKTITAKTGRVSGQRLNDITLDIERINTSDIPFESLYHFTTTNLANGIVETYIPNEPLGIYGSTALKGIAIRYKATRDDEKDKIFQNYAKGNTVLFISGKFKTDWYRSDYFIEKGDYGVKVVFERFDGSELICKLNRDAMTGDSFNYSLQDGYENYVLLEVDGASLKGIKYFEFYAENFARTDFEEEELFAKYDYGKDSELFVSDLRIEFVEYSDVDGYLAYITTPQTNSFDGKYELNLIANLKFNGSMVPEFEKNAQIYWFEQDASIDINSDYYSEFGGLGWRKLDEETAQLVLKKSDFEERLVLKKFYKVVIVYNEYKLTAKKEIYYRIDDMSQFKINLELSADGRAGDLIVEPNWELEGYTTKWQSEDINGVLISEESNENFVLRNIDIANIYGSKTFICTIYFGDESVYTLDRKIYNTSSLQDVVVKFVTDDNGIYHYDEVGNYSRDTRKNITFTVDIKQEEESDDIYHWQYEWGYPENIDENNLMFTITSDEEARRGDDQTSNRTLNYSISSNFKAEKSEDNVIQLKIIIGDREYYFYKELSFTKEGDQGTNGSSLVMNIDIVGSNRAILANGQTQSVIEFEIDMQKDGESTFQGKNIVDYFSFTVSVPMDYKLDNPLYETFINQDISLIDNKVFIQFPVIADLTQKNAIIQFRATPNINADAAHFPHDVMYLMPIPLTNNEEYQTYEYIGPTVVQYDERGYNGKWDNSSLKLVNSIGEDTKLSFTPYGNLIMTEEGAINPPSYYDPNNLIMGVITSDEVYVQPIIGTLNAFSKAILNAWDGSSIEINEENGGYVLASQVGAGIKDISTNTFTGVLMGQLSNRKDSNDQNYGLLGFYQGESTFGFLSDGSGYIGASGIGRIEFNPKSNIASLQSGNYEKNIAGMMINLTDGYINAHNFALDSSFITIDSENTKFILEGPNKTLLKVSDGSYYLQSNNFEEDISDTYSINGTKINLQTGEIKAKNFAVSSSGTANFSGNITGSAITGSSFGTEKGDFYVSSSGRMTAKSANITGNITATTLSCYNGTIGGWSINNSGLYNGEVYLNSDGSMVMGSTAYGLKVNSEGVSCHRYSVSYQGGSSEIGYIGIDKNESSTNSLYIESNYSSLILQSASTTRISSQGTFNIYANGYGNWAYISCSSDGYLYFNDIGGSQVKMRDLGGSRVAVFG